MIRYGNPLRCELEFQSRGKQAVGIYLGILGFVAVAIVAVVVGGGVFGVIADDSASAAVAATVSRDWL